MTRKPLLDGALAARAHAAIDDIARDLESYELPVTAHGGSLAHGSTGIAVFFAELARERGDAAASRAAARHLASATRAVAETEMSASLFEGFVGVAWAIEHLEGDPAALDDVDAALLAFLDNPELDATHELYGGLAGIGLYGLTRGRRAPLGRPIAEATVRALSARAERDADGIGWSTRVGDLPPGALPDGTRVHYNLGMAHGLPGVIALLAHAAAGGVGEARRLLDGAVRWLFARRLGDDAPTRYGPWHEPGEPPRAARAGWCYGDAAIARALLVAADAAVEPSWREEAMVTARRAVARPHDACGVADAGLCHGAAGIAHIMNRLHQVTGDSALADSARAWFERAIDMRHRHPGVGGFASWASDGAGCPFTWRADPGLLAGAAGIGLSLLAATSARPPTWDAVFLLHDVAPSSHGARPGGR